MKKYLLVALMMLSGAANADTAAYLKNNIGGKIVLTDNVCPNYPTMYSAYSSNPNGSTLWGCWYSDQVNVIIRWNDGDFRTYELSGPWVFYENVLKRMKRNSSNGV